MPAESETADMCSVILEPREPSCNAGLAYWVASSATVESPLSEIPALREAPFPVGAPSLPGRFLRHSDEHTVIGMRAVLEAIAHFPDPRPSFEAFGVVGSPCLPGRMASARTLMQLQAEGPATVSPHIVPQCSLHALASAVSVGLSMHGPNIGIGGGPEAIAEGFITSLSLLDHSNIPGLWLVFTEWKNEPTLDAQGIAPPDAMCRGVAICLMPTQRGAARLTITLPGTRLTSDSDARTTPQATGTLAELAHALAACNQGDVRADWLHVCPWGAHVRISHDCVADGEK